jgi:hypothetical protein
MEIYVSSKAISVSFFLKNLHKSELLLNKPEEGIQHRVDPLELGDRLLVQKFLVSGDGELITGSSG